MADQTKKKILSFVGSTHGRIFTFLIIIIFAAGGIFVARQWLDGGITPFSLQGGFFASGTEKEKSETKSKKIPAAARHAVDETGRYTHPTRGFSFTAPEGALPVSNSLGNDMELVTIGDIQIFFYPYDEPAINPERIRIDVPDIVMNNVRAATLDGADALVFTSFESAIGDTYEVWFVHGGYLYQIMTYADKEDELNGLLNTWKF